ncbi:hypothetical protein [Aestuariimicrobium ganziense]|nr:hypothetical protein [Aestuariimicrobium ganziense]
MLITIINGLGLTLGMSCTPSGAATARPKTYVGTPAQRTSLESRALV